MNAKLVNKSTTPLEKDKLYLNQLNQSKSSKRIANSVLYKYNTMISNKIKSNNKLPYLSKTNKGLMQVQSNNKSSIRVKIFIIKNDFFINVVSPLLSSSPLNTFYSIYITTNKSILKKGNNSIFINQLTNQEDILCSSLQDVLIVLYSSLELDQNRLWKITILNDKCKQLITDNQLFNTVSKSLNPILYAKVSLITKAKAGKSNSIYKLMKNNCLSSKQTLDTKSSIFRNKELQNKVSISEEDPFLSPSVSDLKQDVFKPSFRFERFEDSKPSVAEIDSDYNFANYELSCMKSFRDNKPLSPHTYKFNFNFNFKSNEHNADYFHTFNENNFISDEKRKLLLQYNRKKGTNFDKYNANTINIDLNRFNAKSLFNNNIMTIKTIQSAKCPSYYDQYVYSTKRNHKTISKGDFRQVRNYIQTKYLNKDTRFITQNNFSEDNNSDVNNNNNEYNSNNDYEKSINDNDPKAIYLQALYDFTQFFEVIFIPLIRDDDLKLIDCLICNYIFIYDLEFFPINRVKREFLFLAILSKHIVKYHSDMINDYLNSNEYTSKADALLTNDNFAKMIQELYFLLKKVSQDIKPILNTFTFEEKNFKISKFLFLFFGCSDDYFALDEEVSLKLLSELNINHLLLSFQQFVEFQIYIKYGLRLSIEKKANLIKKIIPYKETNPKEEFLNKLDKYFGMNNNVLKLMKLKNEFIEKKYKTLINRIYLKIYKFFYHKRDYLETEHELLLDLS